MMQIAMPRAVIVVVHSFGVNIDHCMLWAKLRVQL